MRSSNGPLQGVLHCATILDVSNLLDFGFTNLQSINEFICVITWAGVAPSTRAGGMTIKINIVRECYVRNTQSGTLLHPT